MASTNTTINSSFKIYWYPLSPYSNPLYYFCNKNNLPHEVVVIELPKMQQKTPEYLKINPFGLIPAIMEEDGSTLSESSTILRYLCDTRDVPDHWYPKDIKKRAQVNLFFDWFQPATATMLSFIFSGTIYTAKFSYVGDALVNLEAKLKDIEEIFLNNRDYLAGDEISIADIQIMFFFCDLDIVGYSLDKFPKIKEWKSRVLATDFKPNYDRFYELGSKFFETIKKKTTDDEKKN